MLHRARDIAKALGVVSNRHAPCPIEVGLGLSGARLADMLRSRRSISCAANLTVEDFRTPNWESPSGRRNASQP